jgi:hypothetical protein
MTDGTNVIAFPNRIVEFPIVVPSQISCIGQKASTIVKVLRLIRWREIAQARGHFRSSPRVTAGRGVFTLGNGDIN